MGIALALIWLITKKSKTFPSPRLWYGPVGFCWFCRHGICGICPIAEISHHESAESGPHCGDLPIANRQNPPRYAICPLRIRGICSCCGDLHVAKQKTGVFCNFLRLGDSFCLRKAEMSRFAADSLRFWLKSAFWRPAATLIAKSYILGRIFCFEAPERLCRPNCSGGTFACIPRMAMGGEA